VGKLNQRKNKRQHSESDCNPEFKIHRVFRVAISDVQVRDRRACPIINIGMVGPQTLLVSFAPGLQEADSDDNQHSSRSRL